MRKTRWISLPAGVTTTPSVPFPFCVLTPVRTIPTEPFLSSDTDCTSSSLTLSSKSSSPEQRAGVHSRNILLPSLQTPFPCLLFLRRWSPSTEVASNRASKGNLTQKVYQGILHTTNLKTEGKFLLCYPICKAGQGRQSSSGTVTLCACTS